MDQAHRGQGLGRVILTHLEQDAVALGKRRAVLQVITANVEARAFYRAAGYSETWLRHGWLRDRLAYPSVLMRRTLDGD